jgi:hypothetical protein
VTRKELDLPSERARSSLTIYECLPAGSRNLYDLSLGLPESYLFSIHQGFFFELPVWQGGGGGLDLDMGSLPFNSASLSSCSLMPVWQINKLHQIDDE